MIGSQSNGNSDAIEAAGFITHTKPNQSPERDANDISSRAIKLNEGWSPTLYTYVLFLFFFARFFLSKIDTVDIFIQYPTEAHSSKTESKSFSFDRVAQIHYVNNY